MDNPYRPKIGRIMKIRQETKTEKTFTIAFEGSSAQCGQFYEFSLPGIGEAPFSVSHIGDGFIESTIRRTGKVSEAIHDLKVEDEVYLRGPYGHGFPMEEFSNQELVVIAGGTGAVPVRSVIRKVVDGTLEVRSLKILFGFRDVENILFKDEIRAWQDAFACFVSLDYPGSNWPGLTGFVNQHIDKLRPSPDGRAIVVGPPPMIKFVADELLEEGVDPARIFVSYERLMQCGIGKCGRCRIESKYVCLDGPVFDYASCKDLID